MASPTFEAAETSRRRRAFALVGLLLLALFYLGGIGGHPLQDPDEGRYAEIPREMIESGDWTTPRLNYVKYFEKPPLLYWMVAGAFTLFGTTDGVARLVPALTGLATLAITFALGQSMLGWRAAWLATGILATAPLFFGIAQSLVIDVPLTACMTGALAAVWMAHRSSRPRRWAVVAAIAAGLGVLAKGPVALVLTGAIALAYLVLRRDWTTLKALLGPLPIAAFTLIVVPWFVLVSRRNPEFPHFFFIHEHLLRFTAHVGHPEGPFYYLPVLLLGALPWSGLALALATRRSGRRAFGSISGDARLFLLLWTGIVLVFFTIASSKLAPYVLPAFPALALLTGGAVDAALGDADARHDLARIVRRLSQVTIGFGALMMLIALAAFFCGDLLANRLEVLPDDIAIVRTAVLGLGGALVAGGVAASWLLGGSVSQPAITRALLALLLGCGLSSVAAIPARQVAKSADELARVLEKERRPGDVLAVYKRIMQSLSFYTRSRVVMIDTLNELHFGAGHAPDRDEYFWSGPDRLRETWQRERMMIATSVGLLPELESVLPTRLHVLARQGGRVLVANFPPTPPADAARGATTP